MQSTTVFSSIFIVTNKERLKRKATATATEVDTMTAATTAATIITTAVEAVAVVTTTTIVRQNQAVVVATVVAATVIIARVTHAVIKNNIKLITAITTIRSSNVATTGNQQKFFLPSIVFLSTVVQFWNDIEEIYMFAITWHV